MKLKSMSSQLHTWLDHLEYSERDNSWNCSPLSFVIALLSVRLSWQSQESFNNPYNQILNNPSKNTDTLSNA